MNTDLGAAPVQCADNTRQTAQSEPSTGEALWACALRSRMQVKPLEVVRKRSLNRVATS